jgi:hypothetical protein
MNDHSPLVSEFETVEQAEACLRWLEGKVAASKADGRPNVEHDEAMKRVRAIIEAKAGKRRHLRVAGENSDRGKTVTVYIFCSVKLAAHLAENVCCHRF